MKRTFLAALLFGAAAIAAFAQNPQGNLDNANGPSCTIAGWARDPQTTDPIQVNIYRDGDRNSGVLTATVTAANLRTDLPYADKNHGFSYVELAASGLFDGATHTIYAYGTTAAGTLYQLGNSRTIKCDPNTVAVYAVRPSMVSGETSVIVASSLDIQGTQVPLNTFTWSSNHPEIVAVDGSGDITALALGIADITVSIGNARAIARIQVVPSRIDVSPNAVTLRIGGTQQFAATAFDVNGAPIPTAVFTWASAGDNGGLTVAGAVDNNGLFTAAASGHFVIRAVVIYPSYAGNFVSQLFGTATVDVQGQHDYTLKRLVSTADAASGLKLRQRNNSLVANDQGKIAMTGSLDGLTSALLQYDGSKLGVLLNGGLPGVVQGGPVWDFSDPAMNADGTVLARVDEMGSGSSLALIRNGNVSTIQVDGEVISADQVNSNNNTITRYSLNDNGDFVYRANYRKDTTSPYVGGLYRYSFGKLSVDRINTDPLPGMTAPVTFGTEFGLDNNGVFYFLASDSKHTGLFREDSDGNVTRLLLTGDKIGGAALTELRQVAVQAATGDVVIFGNTDRAGWLIARFSGASITVPPAVVTGYYVSLLSFNRGGVLMYGSGPVGQGLYTFTNTMRMLLPYGGLAPSGEPVVNVQAAVMLANGDLLLNVATPSNAMAIVRIGAKSTTLFSAGQRVDGVVNFALRDLVGGARQGPAHVTMGGNNNSIFQAGDPGGISIVAGTGDTLPGNSVFYGQYNSKKTPSGSLYLTTNQGVYLIANGVTKAISVFNQTCDSNITCYAPFALAANDQGQVAGIQSASDGLQRVSVLKGSIFQPILKIGDKISGAGSVVSFNSGDFAMDANGRIVVSITGSTASGYVVYSGGTWSALALLNVNDASFGQIIGLSGLKAAGTRFCAQVSTMTGGIYIAAWDGQWTNLVSRGDASPDGNIYTGFNTFDVNRAGEVAFVGNINGTLALLVKTADSTKVVHLIGDALDGNWWVRNYGQLDFRDDRTIYFTVWTLDDKYALYMGRPLN